MPSLRSTPSCSMFTIATSPAFDAHSLPSREVSVLRSKLVIVGAVSSRCVDGGWTVRPKTIFSWSDRSNVFDVDTVSGVASEVIELKSSGDGAIRLDPNPGMTADGMSVTGELGVPPMIQVLRPQMTTSRVIDDITGPEASVIIVADDLDEKRISVSKPSGVVLSTVSLAVPRSGAVDQRTDIHDMSAYQRCERNAA